MSASESTITFLGQSTVRIATPAGKQVLIDPWVMSNPYCPEHLKEVGDLDLVLITHAHRDHFDDAVEVFRRSGATGVASNEFCIWGDRFTMGPREAAYAIRLLGVGKVIPVHYGTFPIFTGTPDALRRETNDIAGLEIIELQPGETYRL